MAGQGQAANGNLVLGLGAGRMQWGAAVTLSGNPTTHDGDFMLTQSDGVTCQFRVDKLGNITSNGSLTVGQTGASSGAQGTVTAPGGFIGNSTGTHTGAVVATTISASGLVTSTVAAGSPILKFAFTNATPVVAFTGSGSTNTCPTTAPAGYLQVIVGSTAYYIPAWL